MKIERTVAVIIPSYNYANFLTEAIESVLSQSILPNEILISDDCSNDHSFAIGYEYQQKYPDLIKVNRNSTNLGIVAHFNKAISLTKSDYICFLGADNIFPKNYIESTKEILNANDNIAIAYTDFELFGNRKDVVFNNFRSDWRKKDDDGKLIIEFPHFNEETKSLLQKKINFIHGSSMFKRTAYEQVNGYEQIEMLPEDFHLFSKIINQNWEAKKATKTTLLYRQHSEEQQNIKVNLSIQLKEYEKLYSQQVIKNKELKNQIELLEIERTSTALAIKRIRNSYIYKIFKLLLYPIKKLLRK
jgi:glycosyltransferase involved in cell wall biosynthesis